MSRIIVTENEDCCKVMHAPECMSNEMKCWEPTIRDVLYCKGRDLICMDFLLFICTQSCPKVPFHVSNEHCSRRTPYCPSRTWNEVEKFVMLDESWNVHLKFTYYTHTLVITLIDCFSDICQYYPKISSKDLVHNSKGEVSKYHHTLLLHTLNMIRIAIFLELLLSYSMEFQHI